MQTTAAVGLGVAAYYAMTDHEVDPRRHYVELARPRTPSPPPRVPTPTPPRPIGRLGRSASMELPLNEYIKKCCKDVVGPDGSPGIENHQAIEQIFFLQVDTIRALEDHITFGHEVDDRGLRLRAAAIRARTRKQVESLEQDMKRSPDFR